MNCIKCGASLPEAALYCPYCGKKQSATERKSRRRANGEGSVFRYGAGYRAQIVVGYKMVDGRSKAIYRTKSGFKTKREALEYLETLRKQPVREVPTLAKLWAEYQDAAYKKLSESRKEKYRIAWPKLGAIQLARVDLLTTGDLQSVINDKASTFYPARDMRDLLSILFQIAMANRFVSVNLAEYIELPPLNAKQQETFTKDELLKLWQDYADGNWWTGYILLMCYTGIMPGELMEARKSGVNLDANTITGQGIKTDERKAKPIILPDEIIPVLADLMEHTPGDKLIKINKDNFYKVYYETLERAGIRKLVPYTCRHTRASTLADNNVSAALIQSIMRHASYATTQKYIHADVSKEIDAANRTAAAIKP